MPLKELTAVRFSVNLPSLGHLQMAVLCVEDIYFNIKTPSLILVWLNMLSDRSWFRISQLTKT